MSKIQIGSSLDLPVISKKLFWASLGAGFIFIGLVPAWVLHRFNSFTTLFFITWIVLAFWLSLVVSYPRTRVMEDGVLIKNIFTRRRKSYKWTEFKAFVIIFSFATGRKFLLLYLGFQEKVIQIGLGKRPPEDVSAFLTKTAKLIEKGKPKGEYCKYHIKEPAHYICDKCGATLCHTCVETKRYSTVSFELSCLVCFYKQFYKMSRVALIIGICFGIFPTILPYQNNSWALYLIALGILIAPIFLSISLGATLANFRRLQGMEERNINFDYEGKYRLNRILIIINVAFTAIALIRLILVREPYYIESIAYFQFQYAFIPFILLHQGLFWIVFLKFKPKLFSSHQ
ncbi:MAG: hypothetical protein HWN65_09300 [Candidatus Helarchaeota archaeon]|nr:hypothetical protein [Candidatus Helarchaeota archaeon]